MEARECLDMICRMAHKIEADAWAQAKAVEVRTAAEELLGHFKAVAGV